MKKAASIPLPGTSASILSSRPEDFEKPGNAAAFTLIELSVGIAILVTLIAISVPVVGRLRSAADMTGCINNLRQIGQIVLTAAADNGGRIPAIRGDDSVVAFTSDGEVASDKQGPTLPEFIEANGGTADLLVCPAAKRRHQTSTPSYLWVGGIFGPVMDSNAPMAWEFTADQKARHKFQGTPAMNVLLGDGSVNPSSYPEHEKNDRS